MALVILNTGFEDEVRTKLGVTEDEITDTELNSKFVSEVAEAKIIKRVPDYASIVDATELLFLELAVILQVAADLCLTMPARMNTEVSTLDVKWKKGKINWEDLYARLLGEIEDALESIESVDVVTISDPILIDKITYDRDPIGGEG